jgi:vacuolar-type H+-ATPase subunit F/Vma7
MTKRIVFFTSSDALHGFSLAGFEQHVCKNSEELEKLLDQFLVKTEYGLFVIDERLITEKIDDMLRERERGLDLIFVIMPPPLEMETKREDYALRLLRKSIGYHIQLNL